MRQTAKLSDAARVPTLINNSHQQEQCRRLDAVIDHMQHGAVYAVRIKGKEAEHHNAH